MSTDLEDLLRDTMVARSLECTEAPHWAGPPVRSGHRGWAAVGAVAATVAVVAGGAALLGRHGDPAPGASGDAPPACIAALPADWRAALARTDTLFHGRPVQPWVQPAYGVLVGTVVDAVRATEVVRAAGGATSVAMTVPAGRLVARVDADARWIVVSSAPDGPNSAVDRLTVLDTADGTTTDLTTAHVQGRGAVLQDGQVYWVDGTTVERYDAGSGRYSAVGRTEGSTELDRDVRGVGWPGGSVPAADAPDFVPGFFGDALHYQPVYSDGTNVAWQDGLSPVLHWASPDGAETSWTVDVGTLPETSPDVTGVAGPIVFYGVNDTGSGTYALDTRTGAVAHLGDDLDVNYPSFVSPGGVSLVHAAGLTTTTLNPSGLSRLTC